MVVTPNLFLLWFDNLEKQTNGKAKVLLFSVLRRRKKKRKKKRNYFSNTLYRFKRIVDKNNYT